jgi:hypothetical protein
MPERVEDPKDNHSNDPSWTQERERQFYDARYEIKESGKRRSTFVDIKLLVINYFERDLIVTQLTYAHKL